jgi:hypothetical protein
MRTGRKLLEFVSFSSAPVIYFLLNIVILVSTLLTKLKRSVTGLNATQPAFEELTKTCLQRNLPVEAWRSAESLAMEERGEKLKIFEVKHRKAPSLAQITLDLTEKMENSCDATNIVDWIADGIKTESDQYVL